MCQDDSVRRKEVPPTACVLIVQERETPTSGSPVSDATDVHEYNAVVDLLRITATTLSHLNTNTPEELRAQCIDLERTLSSLDGVSLWLSDGKPWLFRQLTADTKDGGAHANPLRHTLMRIEPPTLAKLAAGGPLDVSLTSSHAADKVASATIAPILAADDSVTGVICVHGLLPSEPCKSMALHTTPSEYCASAPYTNDDGPELRAVLDAMIDCVHVVDRDMVVRLLNKPPLAWRDEMGLDANPIGRCLFDIFPFLKKHVADEYAQVFETGQACFTCEEHVLGERFYATDTRKIPIIHDGEVTQVLTIVRDITSETRTQRLNVALSQLSVELANATSVVEAYSIALHTALSVSNAENGVAWIIDEEGGLRPIAAHGFSESLLASLEYIRHEYAVTCMLTGPSASFIARSELENASDTVLQLPEAIVALANIPICHEGNALGCLNMGATRLDAFDDVEVRLVLETIAAQLGTSVARLNIQQKLQQSVELYSLLTDSISDIVCTFGLDLRLQYVSPSSQSFLGYDRNEVLGKHITEFLTPDSASRALEAIEHSLLALRTTGEAPDHALVFEYEFTQKDGTPVWGELTRSFLRTPGGDVTGVLAVIRDISERKRAEEGLRRRDALLQAVASASEELLRDPDWNRAMVQALSVLGTAAGIDQAYVYQIRQGDDEQLIADCHTQWAAGAMDTVLYDTRDEPVTLYLDTTPPLRDALLASEVFTCIRSHMAADECNALSAQGVLSMAAVPMLTDGELWGFIGFVDSHEERLWLSAELDALRSAASVLSASIQQQLTKQALRASEEEYRELVQSANSQILRLNNDGEIEFANKYACDFFGYELDELIGRPVIGTITPAVESSGRDLSSLLTAIHANPDAYAINENENMKRNGERVWIVWTNRALHDDDGNLSGMLCIGNDVTASRKAADELRWHKRMTDQSSDHIALIDSDYRYQAVNSMFPKLFGIPREEIIGRHMAEMLGMEYFETNAKAMVDRCLAGHEAEIEAWFAFPTQDRPRYFHIQYVPYVDEDGKILGVVVTGHDFTDRKRMEEDLEKADKFSNDVIAFAHFGIVVLDLDLRYIVWNPFMERLTGLSQREAIGKKPAELFEDTEPHSFEEIMQQALQGDNGVISDAPYHVLSTGKSGWTVAQYSPYTNPAGETIGILGVIQDITEQRHFEQHRQELAKLESIGALAGGLAHDFNNHLMAIIGNITLARIQLGASSDVTGLLEQAEQACLQARHVTQQLLTFAKGGEPVKELISLDELIRSTAKFTMSGAKTQCMLNIAEDLWPAEIDEGQINQVLQNLLINATQAMPDGGEIQVIAENIWAEPDDFPQLSAGPYVRIAVVDEGIGIPPQHLARIFEPYFSTKQMGSGLGLATSHSIIMRHGGCIEVTSASGKGTTFEIYLPAVTDVKTPTKATAITLLRGSGRILVMDDDELVRRAAAQLLQSLGYVVETVPDGFAAVELYKYAKTSGKPFDAVFFDLTVPGKMGGEEAVRELQRFDPRVKAIASSGYANNRAMASYEEYGFAAVIAKPYTVHQLSRVMATVLGEANSAEEP